jgi:hypothetical protein
VSSPNTSAIFTVWRTVERLLNEVVFPPVAENPDRVAVWFGDPDLAPPAASLSNERAVITGSVGDVDQGWGPTGNYARAERFTVFVYVVSAIPGFDEHQAADRLAELCAQVELMFRAVNALRQAGTYPSEFAEFPLWELEVTRFRPFIDSSPEGSVGKAEFTVSCHFRIGSPAVTL